MFGQRSHRAFLSLVCLFVLVLVPLTLGAQTPEPSSQQDQSNQNSVNQNNQKPDQSNQTNVDKSSDVTSQDQGTREKPSQTDPNAVQGQNPQQTRPSRQGAASGAQAGAEREGGLPSTAGELPLLAVIGLACLAGAAGTQVLAKAKSIR